MSGVKINAWETVGAAYRLARTLGDARPALREFYAYHAREIDSVFQRLGRGGTHRDVTWPGWSPGSLGRRRPSGARVTLSSKLLQDTGRLRQDVTTGVFVLSREELRYGPSLFYAGKQFERRNPYTVTRADEQMMYRIFEKAAQAALRGNR